MDEALLGRSIRHAMVANPAFSLPYVFREGIEVARALELVAKGVDAREAGSEALAREIEVARLTLLRVAARVNAIEGEDITGQGRRV
jgi:hypothetical protein